MQRLKKMITSLVKPDKHKNAVRTIIVLKNGKCYRQCLHHLQKLGIQPLKHIKESRTICCHLDHSKDLSALKKHPFVRTVEKDLKIRSHKADRAISMNSQITPWGIRRIQAPAIWSKTEGGGIRIAVLDSGIARHPDLRTAGRFNAIQGTSSLDLNGHGTHVAGTVAALNNRIGVVGASPKIRLYGVKVLDKDGLGYVSDIIEGIAWCIRNRIRVINMSLGMKQESEALHQIIRRAYRNGIIMVASCGNDGKNTGQVDYPARYKETIAVAASNSSNKIAGFSSRGSLVDVAAPGVGVLSTYLGNSYARLSGTSMAAPHVTGTAALLLSINPRLTPGETLSALKRTARRLLGFSTRSQGSGLINALRASSLVNGTGTRKKIKARV